MKRSILTQTCIDLIRSEKLHRSFVQNCPFGIVRTNLVTESIDQANPVIEQVLGYTRQELFSMHTAEFYANQDDRNSLLAALKSCGSVREYEVMFRKKDGGLVRTSFSGYIDTDPKTGHKVVQGYVIDITRHHELQQQLSRAQRMDAIGRLAGGVAHDFNNIMQSITLTCEFALQSPLVPPLESKLRDIMEQAGRAADITRHLLAFSRNQVLQPRAISLNDSLRNSLPMITRLLGPAINTELQLGETLDSVFIDPDQLAIVLMHLASNARAAMPQGGTLRLTTSSNGDDSGYVLLSVADNGIGMDSETVDRIFEPFSCTGETFFTAGLGLATIHGIIAQSRGRIECDSTPGQGTTFRLYLPVAPEPAATVASPAPAQPRILLVEDDPGVNGFLASALARQHFLVDSVANGEEALASFAEKPYDIVITDIVMPKLGGVELTRRLRQRQPHIPVILMSGYSEETYLLQQLDQRNTIYLQKPFSFSQLTETIRKLVTPSRGGDGAWIH